MYSFHILHTFITHKRQEITKKDKPSKKHVYIYAYMYRYIHTHIHKFITNIARIGYTYYACIGVDVK